MKQVQICLVLFLGLFSLEGKAFTTITAALQAVVPMAVQTSASIGSAPSLYQAMLPGNIVYVRAASFTPATTWDDLTTTTSQNAATARGLILDLRSNASPQDFAGALRVAGVLTTGPGSSPFQAAAYHTGGGSMALLIVLTNRETRGAAEALAGTLQARGALVMGEATAGARPVTPDVTTTANGADEALSLALIDRRQVTAVITETEARHRMSEAALVRGQDPEQDAFIADHEQTAPAAPMQATRDMALVEALDSFKAIRVVEGQASSSPARIADSSSVAGQTVIASSGLGR